MESRARIGHIIDTCRRGSPTNQIIGLSTSGGFSGGGVSMQWQTHTNTHSDTRDTQDGWSLGQVPDVILTHVGVAPH